MVGRNRVAPASSGRPVVMAALSVDGLVLSELSPNRPGPARRRMDIGVVVLGVGEDRSGQGWVRGRPGGNKAGVETGELERDDDESRSRCGNWSMDMRARAAGDRGRQVGCHDVRS